MLSKQTIMQKQLRASPGSFFMNELEPCVPSISIHGTDEKLSVIEIHRH